ncbi:MAG TPA: hypothetical protein VFF68_15010 [Anaerolineaceae bacterium]|nr:hypothetical protein [Anaerolineaceae bacterium]
MRSSPDPTDPERPTPRNNWATPISAIRTSTVPEGALNLNMEGRQVTGPLQGFGQLWKKTYRVRLSGSKKDPIEVMQIWKQNFSRYQPPNNHFYFSVGGTNPGEIVFIDTTLPTLPGTPGVIPLASGVLILYEDETSFTVATPEGHPESGWNTFSTFEEDGVTVAQIQGIARASDPIFEFGLRVMGGAKMQEGTWIHVLTMLANDLGVSGNVTMNKDLLDPTLNWKAAGNIWKNAGLRTMAYKVTAPVRWIGRKLFAR